jgi:hypothetical protein
MSTHDRLEVNRLKQDIVKSEMAAIAQTIESLNVTKKSLERHRSKLITRMMELTSEEVRIQESYNQST